MERHGPINNIGIALLMLLLLASATGRAFYTETTGAGMVMLSATPVSLGPMRVDPTDPRGRRNYYETVNGFPVVFQGYERSKNAWEVHIYADDFRNETGDVIPVSQLRWRTPDGVYQAMAGLGDYHVLAASRDYSGNHRWSVHTIPVSFYLSLTGDEYAGTYESTVYVSIVSL